MGVFFLLFFGCNDHKKNNVSQTVWGWILEAYKLRAALRTRILELASLS